MGEVSINETGKSCALNKGGEKVLGLLQPTHGAVILL